MILCRNTTCIAEGLFQNIPTYIFENGDVWFKELPENLYFRSSEDVIDIINQCIEGKVADIVKVAKVFVCGDSNPFKAHQEFFLLLRI